MGATIMTIIPARKRLLFIIALLAAILFLTSFREPQRFLKDSTSKLQQLYRPVSEQHEEHQAGEPTTSDAQTNSLVVDDVQRFFVPHNITPAEWENGSSDIRCAERWIFDHAMPTSPNFVNWETAYLDSNCPVYPIPNGGLIFHVYWNGEFRPHNDMIIEAFLATQRLGDGHRLYYWYKGDGPSDETRKKFEKYSEYFEYRELDFDKEGDGWCVKDMPEWNNVTYLVENDMFVQSESDILRNFLLGKYGGIWLDEDTIPIRDMTPMIRCGPSAAGVGSNEWNSNVFILGPPNTRVTNKVLEATCSFSANKETYEQRHGPNAIQPWQWYWLWNDALLKTCDHKLKCGISRIPVFYTDGFSHVESNSQVNLPPCEPDDDYSTGMQLPKTLYTIFTWHARVAKFPDECVDMSGKTIAGAVRRRIRQLLDRGLEMGGRDLFPGPYYSV